MSHLGIGAALSAMAHSYPRGAIASPASPVIDSSDSASVGSSLARQEEPGVATPSAVAASPSDDTSAESQSQQQAQIQRQLSQVEAELLRVTQTEIRELASRDREVRTHEQAHKAVGGQYAGAVSYSYERGPDGRMYAVGGSVAIDTAPVPGDPAATLQKLQQVQRAALAPAQPSAQDLSVAAQAAQAMAQARAELATDILDGSVGNSTGDSTGREGAQAVSADQASADNGVEKSLALYRQIGAAESLTVPGLQAQA